MNLNIPRKHLSDPYQLAKIFVALTLGYFFLFTVLPTVLSIWKINNVVSTLDVTPAMRSRVIASLADQMEKHYLDADKARKIATELRQAHSKGEFNDITTPTQLTRRLTDFLYISSNDGHARVDFVPPGLPEFEFQPFWYPPREFRTGIGGLIDWIGRAQATMGVERVTQSDEGIGYLQLSGFYSPELAAPKLAAAMDKLADSKAIIIDLRSRGGGHPETVALLESYFFDKPTHLLDIVAPRTGERRRMVTSTDLEGKRYGETRPVYILTSSQTFSGSEDFAYTMQNLKRATVVGEITGGGANGTSGARLDAHFIAAIPCLQAIHPVTKTNWEGTGVQPDIVAPAGHAFTIATKEILKKMAKKS